jgi:hypothetical protein
MLPKNDSQPELTRKAIIAVKETDLLNMDEDLEQGFMHLLRCTKTMREARPGDYDPILRGNILELRAALEDIFLSIRLTENELHDLKAPGW